MISAHKSGAVCYALWGAVHVAGGLYMWFALANGGSAEYLEVVATNAPVAEFAQPLPEAAEAVFAFHAFNLAWIGAVVLTVALRLNWKNSVAGYWINLAVVSATDLGLVATMLAPRIMAFSDGAVGVALWVAAAVFSTIGIARRPR